MYQPTKSRQHPHISKEAHERFIVSAINEIYKRDLTISQFCKQYHINRQTFYYYHPYSQFQQYYKIANALNIEFDWRDYPKESEA